MSHEAQEGQPEVPVYDVDQLLAQAQSVGIGGIIDCGCELPHLMTAVQMALDHPGNVHAALAIHPNESVLHGHRGVPGPDGLPLKYKPYHDTSFEDALAEVHRLATTYPRASGGYRRDRHGPLPHRRRCQGTAARGFPRAYCPGQGTGPAHADSRPRLPSRRSSKPCWSTARPNAPYSTRIPATVRWPRLRANMAGI